MVDKEYTVKRSLRMFEQVANRIADYIISENLPVGAQIPTERELSATLEVSRSSIREGLRVLELMKFLESKQGGGTFVSKPPYFIIPYNELKKNPGSDTLHQYYEMFVENSRLIVINYLKKAKSVNPDEQWLYKVETCSWEAFCILLEKLGSTIENPLYFSLWSNTKTFLEEHHYFNNLKDNIPYVEFIEYFNNKDLEKLDQFFDKCCP
ncbi:FadR/GntR family transcriptional regulator [Neobacillus mesonae]|uniref:FadR/GntR family transcriptional regulator n=1 Tax=Neobacillus mesonae TaxID=1193713 RepID=UPI002573707F|nr:GntR family transcriptional regulator [Neobacillus mesonae]MED4205893.1 GntR family transcriptional regulator [Neobacillus mesonae]